MAGWFLFSSMTITTFVSSVCATVGTQSERSDHSPSLGVGAAPLRLCRLFPSSPRLSPLAMGHLERRKLKFLPLQGSQGYQRFPLLCLELVTT